MNWRIDGRIKFGKIFSVGNLREVGMLNRSNGSIPSDLENISKNYHKIFVRNIFGKSLYKLFRLVIDPLLYNQFSFIGI